jgi:hypothetical protein
MVIKSMSVCSVQGEIMTTSTATSNAKPKAPHKTAAKPKGGTSAGTKKPTPLGEIRLCTEMVLDDPMASIAHAGAEQHSGRPQPA